MKKILIVFGTRPEAIKMLPLVQEFQKHPNMFEVKVCVSGQHREILDQVLKLFKINPDYDLDIMKKNQDLYDITTRVLLGMKSILSDFKPNVVFVHGDTSTTFSVALAAFYQQIKVAHVEAGLRTGDIYSPWPEEANRKLTTQLTHYNFAPTLNSRDNLLKEQVKAMNVIVTGNTVIDALFMVLDKIETDKSLEEKIISSFAIMKYTFVDNRKIILVTGHRRENHGQGIIHICEALKYIAQENQDIDIIYPVHPNPNIQMPVRKLLSGIVNIYLIEPLEYEEFVYLMSKSYVIITDSGGIQEEAPSLGKPVLVMRDTTERPEALEAGTVKLVGTNKEKIISETQNLLKNRQYYLTMVQTHNPYGNGDASSKIVKYIKEKMEEL